MPKKILFIISRFMDGGIETVLIEYLRYLSKDPNYKVTLAIGVYMGDLEVYKKRIPSNVEVKYLVKARIFAHVRYKRAMRAVSKTEKLLDEIVLTPVRRYMISKKIKYLAENNDTIIDFDCCHYSYLKRINKKALAFFHFSFKQYANNSPRRMRRIGRHLNNYNYVVTISDSMNEEGKEMFPFLKDKLIRMYNPKDFDRLHRLSHEMVQSDKINAPFMLVVERLQESQKDISTILEAYKLLCDKYSHNEKLYIIGKGSSESQLKALAQNLGIDHNVEFLGFIENPYPWIAKSILMIHSAKYEGLPTAMIEGLILGKPIIATDCPTGPKEILDDGKAGVLVPVGDATAMAAAMHRLLDDKTLANAFSSEAKRYAKTFAIENTMVTFEQLL